MACLREIAKGIYKQSYVVGINIVLAFWVHGIWLVGWLFGWLLSKQTEMLGVQKETLRRLLLLSYLESLHTG